MSKPTLAELRAVTYKRRDAWWTVLLVDPIAVRLVRMVAGVRGITPNRVTFAAFALGLASAACFLGGTWPWLIAGALVYHVAFILDCVDGKLARWRSAGSTFGAWVDFILDQIRIGVCTLTLMGGQYRATGRAVYLVLAVVVVFLTLFRYVNGMLIESVRNKMRGQLAGPGEAAFLDEVVDVLPAARAETFEADGQTVVDIQHTFRSRYGLVIPLRNWLTAHRIRPNVVSGIEFQMFVLIIAPLTGLVLPVTTVAIGLMVVFEVLLCYKFWLSTRDFDRLMRESTPAGVPPAQRTAVPAEATGAVGDNR